MITATRTVLAAGLLFAAAICETAGAPVRSGKVDVSPAVNKASVAIGSGCSNEVRAATPAALETVLRSDFTGCVIIPRDTTITLTATGIPLKSGVLLLGERGALGSRPLIRTNNESMPYNLFEIAGNGVTVSGLHFLGPANGSRDSSQPYVTAIQVTEDADNRLGRNILITDCEFNQWTDAGVEVISTHAVKSPQEYLDSWQRFTRNDAALVSIDGNFIHDNAREDGGYGVAVGSGAYATIEGNVFDLNRHAVTSDGYAHSGYIARYNYVLKGGFMQKSYYNQHFDVHGTGSGGYGGIGGEYYEIADNAIRGDQTYYWGFKTRPSLMLRAAPTIGAYFNDNFDVHDDLDSTVALKTSAGDLGWGEDEAAFHFHSFSNRFKTDNSSDLAIGDFDGDGRTDVFVSTGTAWFYSSAASEPWQFLQASDKTVDDLAFADIDNDGTTDVLYRDARGLVSYSRSGRVAWAPLTTSPVPLKDMRFGDFDGDGKTDMFYTKDGQWHVWYGRTRAWTPTQTSSFPVSALLFGDFDDVKGTDVVAVTGGMWAFSSGATGFWTNLNRVLKQDFTGAVTADFDDDGKSDIAFDEGSQRWSYSSGGRSELRTLRAGTGQPAYPALRSLLIGHFDGKAAPAEVVGFLVGGEAPLTDCFAIWRGGAQNPFARHSRYFMR